MALHSYINCFTFSIVFYLSIKNINKYWLALLTYIKCDIQCRYAKLRMFQLKDHTCVLSTKYMLVDQKCVTLLVDQWLLDFIFLFQCDLIILGSMVRIRHSGIHNFILHLHIFLNLSIIEVKKTL